MARRVALMWVCDGGHQAPTANLLGGRGEYGGERTLLAEMACLRHVCACGIAAPPNANSPDRCRSVPCGRPAHLELVDVVCGHPNRINARAGYGGQCGVCGDPMPTDRHRRCPPVRCTPNGEQPASSEQAAIDDAMALTRMYG